jgi:hypothetical protein
MRSDVDMERDSGIVLFSNGSEKINARHYDCMSTPISRNHLLHPWLWSQSISVDVYKWKTNS